MSAFGGKRTPLQTSPLSSAHPMTFCTAYVCFWPKADIVGLLIDPFLSNGGSCYDLRSNLGQTMRRRDFITFFGGVAMWPLAAHAQQSAMRIIGFVNSGGQARLTRPCPLF